MPAARAWRNMEFVDQDEANKKPAANCPMWDGTGRQAITAGKFVNYLFDNFRLVKGEDIRKYYAEKNHAPGSGQLQTSCMRYDGTHGGRNCQTYFDIYIENPDKCNMLVLLDDNGKVLGRALVWFGLKKPLDKIFMDRIYTLKQSDEELFKKYANEKGWLWKYRQAANDQSYIENGQRIDKSMAVTLKPKEYKKYPYMDTFKYYNPKTGRLGTDAGNPVEGRRRIRMEATDGSFQYID